MRRQCPLALALVRNAAQSIIARGPNGFPVRWARRCVWRMGDSHSMDTPPNARLAADPSDKKRYIFCLTEHSHATANRW